MGRHKVDKTANKQHPVVIGRPFVKGVSGNPNGRPNGSLSIVNELRKKLMETPDGDKRTYLQLFIQKVLKKVLLDEDTTMMKDLIDRIDGKPKQSFEASGSLAIEGVNIKLTQEKNLIAIFQGLPEAARNKISAAIDLEASNGDKP